MKTPATLMAARLSVDWPLVRSSPGLRQLAPISGRVRAAVHLFHFLFFGFLGIVIENYAGAFPLWLAPVQNWVIPISEKFIDYARSVHESRLDKGLPSPLHLRDDRVEGHDHAIEGQVRIDHERGVARARGRDLRRARVEQGRVRVDSPGCCRDPSGERCSGSFHRRGRPALQ